MNKRKGDMGLGRGLNALLGDPDPSPAQDGWIQIPISQVEPGLNQPRTHFDSERLTELANSIRIHGMIQPLTVRRLPSGYYQIIAGERRWRAAREAGLTQIPAMVVEADDRQVKELALIENLQREDLNPVEEAQGYHALMTDYGLTQEQVAERMGKSRSAVANTLRLLSLPQELLHMVAQGALSAGHARTILGVSSPTLQQKVAKQVLALGLSVRQTEALIKTLQKKSQTPPPTSSHPLDLYLQDLERSLSGRLGRKVTIQHRGKKGNIQLEFYNEEDLEALLELLNTLQEEGGVPRA